MTADLVNATGANARPGRRPGQGVEGGALDWPTEAVFNGAMSVHGPGRTGMGPNSRPRWFLVVLGGGGGLWCCFVGTGGVPRKVRRPHVVKPSAPLR